MSLPDFYSLRCRTHFKALLRVDFDRVDGALFVRCATDGELLGVYRVRPKGCECLSPSQREGRSVAAPDDLCLLCSHRRSEHRGPFSSCRTVAGSCSCDGFQAEGRS